MALIVEHFPDIGSHDISCQLFEAICSSILIGHFPILIRCGLNRFGVKNSITIGQVI